MISPFLNHFAYPVQTSTGVYYTLTTWGNIAMGFLVIGFSSCLAWCIERMRK